MKNLLLILFFTLLSLNSNAQRPILTDEEQISEIVIAEINDLFQSKDFIKTKARKYADVKGAMTVDVGIVQNGKVSTFFKVDDSEVKNIDFINYMSNYILSHKFQFKLQKQQRYKVRYSITF
jgi:hypothetical protein